MASFNKLLRQLRQTAFCKKWQIGRGLPQRNHAEVPILAPRPCSQPRHISGGMMLPEKLENPRSIGTISAKEQI
jgi:hypothetical protein